MDGDLVFPRKLPDMRRVALAAGVLVLLAAWFSPLPGLVESPFARHMIAHVAVFAVAAPLLALWLVPAVRRAIPGAEPLVAPLPAALIGFAVVWTWHLPLLHGLARFSDAVRSLEQASILAAGLLLWTAALRPVTRNAAADERILALLATALHMVLLGTLLTLAARPLYPHGIRTLADVYAHLAGQQLGGLLMLLGGLPYLAAGLYGVGRLLRRPAYRPVPDAGSGYASRPRAAGPARTEPSDAGIDVAGQSALHEGIDVASGGGAP